jgi:two-component system chemotaxis response regulator CheB
VPILVVQHITTGFTAGLAAWLSSVCPFRVKVAQEAEALVPRTVYLAPDDRHLGVSPRGIVTLSAAPPVGGFRPSGTPLFESVAHAFGRAAVAVIHDRYGRRRRGGPARPCSSPVDRSSPRTRRPSVVFGMPGAAVAAGLAHSVLPLEAIAARLVTLV